MFLLTALIQAFCGLTYYIFVIQKRYINDTDNGFSSDTTVFLIVSDMIYNFKILYDFKMYLKVWTPFEGEGLLKSRCQRENSNI